MQPIVILNIWPLVHIFITSVYYICTVAKIRIKKYFCTYSKNIFPTNLYFISMIRNFYSHMKLLSHET